MTARSTGITKRVFDVVVAGGALIVTAPLLALIAAAIKLTSAGPVLFRQVRVGRAGVPFRIRKFRTMRVDADGPRISTAGDTRVTTIGRVLRATKLDELPQLVDVATGTMSLVGPRPEVPEYVALWPVDLRDEILSVRPGITDPVTVELRDEAGLLATVPDPDRYYRETLLPAKARAYADYVRNRSLAGDLRVIGRTAVAVVRGGRGAPA